MFEELLARPIPADPKQAAERRAIFKAARPTYAACLVGVGRVQEADRIILEHLRDDPFFQLTPGRFPVEVADRFDAVRRDNAAELNAAIAKINQDKQELIRRQQRLQEQARLRLKTVEQMASEMRIVQQRSRLVAALPFGAGQFQNDNIGLGVFFASSQALAISGTIATTAVGTDLLEIRCQQDGLDCDEVRSQYNIVRTLNWISFGTTIALIAAGIIEAQVSFEPTTTVIRKRKIPPRIIIEPEVGTTQTGGVFVGLRGAF